MNQDVLSNILALTAIVFGCIEFIFFTFVGWLGYGILFGVPYFLVGFGFVAVSSETVRMIISYISIFLNFFVAFYWANWSNFPYPQTDPTFSTIMAVSAVAIGCLHLGVLCWLDRD
ncbi:MAG: hypothetical protein E4H14_11150 [Candidatus Thorarchaeota archaeon]|nr:MAG: hypothetical protein E4H14_11150 [Candidatus Thorarchaeota archaeon]